MVHLLFGLTESTTLNSTVLLMMSLFRSRGDEFLDEEFDDELLADLFRAARLFEYSLLPPLLKTTALYTDKFGFFLAATAGVFDKFEDEGARLSLCISILVLDGFLKDRLLLLSV